MDNAEQANIVTDPVTQAACPKCGAELEVAGIPPFTEVQCPTCGAVFQSPAKFGSFLLLQRLGQGGMGGVYRSRDTGLNREVAIKVMLKSLGDDPAFVESFQREAQAAAKLNHPNIAQIYSFGKEKGQPYIAMELVTGGSLDKMMAKEGPLDPGVVIHIGEQIANGLSDAADAGLVHGDVKPENILFDNDHNAKLVDFGLAAMLTPENEVWGTPYYISPEKVRRMKTDFRADIYSLGGTLYHAICGVPPYDGPDATAVVKARFEGPYKPMAEIRKGITPELEAIIARMLEVDPAKRYPTYRSLINDMEKFLKTVGPIKMAPKTQKKFVIKGSNAAAAIAATTGNVGENGSELPPGMTPVSDIPEESDAVDKRRGCKLFALIGGGVILLAMLVTGGIFWYLHHQSVVKEKAEYAQIEQHQGKVRANIAEFVRVARERVEKLKAFPDEAMGYAKAAADEAVGVLGESARAGMVPAEPPEYPLPSRFTHATIPVAGNTNANETNTTATAAGTNAVTAAGSTNAPAATGTNAPVAKVATNAAAAAKVLQGIQAKMAAALLKAKMKPADIQKVFTEFKSGKLKELPAPMAALTNEVAAAVRELAAAGALDTAMASVPEPFKSLAATFVPPADVKPAEKEPAAEESTAEESTAEENAENVPPVVGMVRTMYDDAYAVKAAFSLAQRVLAAIEEHAKEAEKHSNVTKKDAEDLTLLNNALKEEVDILAFDKRIIEISRRTGILKKALESVKNEITSLLAIKRQEKLDAEKKAKAEAEAEKKRQEEAALKEKADAEKAKIAEMEKAAGELVKSLDFSRARSQLKGLEEEVETDEGKSALLTALERVQRIKDFHAYLSKAANGYKSAKGWSVGASDLKTMTVSGKKIFWKEIYNKNIMVFGELVMSLVATPDAVKSLHLRQKTKLMTNAALALCLFCADTESAQTLAKKLAVEAAEKFEADAEEIHSLLPQFFQ